MTPQAAWDRGHDIGLAYLWGRDDAGDPVSHDEITAFAAHHAGQWWNYETGAKGSRPPVARAWHQWRKAGRTDQRIFV